jgi:hypothetical protein
MSASPRFRWNLRWPFVLVLALVLLHPWLVRGCGLFGARVPYDRETWRHPPEGVARAQMLDGFLEHVEPVGKPGYWIAMAAGVPWEFRPYGDGFCVPLGSYARCPLAPERWLWIDVDAGGIVRGVEVLRAPREPIEREPLRSPWRPIPLDVVARIDGFESDRFDGVAAVRCPEGEWPGEDADAELACWVKATVLDGALVVDADTSDGFSGARLDLRLTASAGEPSLEARAIWFTDMGPFGVDPLEDLHGVASVEAVGGDRAAPLRLRVHLLGFRSAQFRASSFLQAVRADVELAWDPAWRGAWIDALREPRSLDALADAGLPRDVRVLRGPGNVPCDDLDPRVGGLLAEGRVDAAGRRVGAWLTFYASGARRTEVEYAAGLADGEFRAWHRDGHLESEGHFASGLRQGTWLEHDADGTVEETRWVDGEVE